MMVIKGPFERSSSIGARVLVTMATLAKEFQFTFNGQALSMGTSGNHGNLDKRLVFQGPLKARSNFDCCWRTASLRWLKMTGEQLEVFFKAFYFINHLATIQASEQEMLVLLNILMR